MAATGGPKVIIPRRHRGKLSPVRAGLIAVALVTIFTYLAFSKQLPWEQPFEIKAVFQTSNNLRLDSPVRIAGVNVGDVTKVEREDGSDLVEVTMQMDEKGLPVHKDATASIRSRIFLEGNFFVDLHPGTPGADNFEDGDTIPATQTSTPVQLDQILTALQTNDREALQDLLKGLGSALMDQPSAADDANEDPVARGDTAAKALNDSFNDAPGAFKGTTQVNQALLGTEKHDLSKLIAGLEKVTSALATNEEQLKDFITNFNRFFRIFAAEQASLTRAIHELGPALEAADESLTSLNVALPQLSAFARDILPGVEETPATITAMTPWIAQSQKLFSQAELGGLLNELQPATSSLASAVKSSKDLLQQTNLFSRCFNEVILPASDTVLQDGVSTSGMPSWKEFWYTMVGFAGDAQGFDGNGAYTRTATGGGSTLIKTNKLSGRPVGRDQLFGNAIAPPLGTRPKKPSKKPPYKTDRACYKNAKPNLNGPAAGPGPPDATVSAARAGGGDGP